MTSDPKLALLRAVPLFARLGPAEMQRVGQLFDDIEVPAGKVLMRQGELGAEMFVVSSGRLRAERDGRQLGEHGPGGWVGEMALLGEGRRTATVTAVEPSRLFVIAHREFHSLLDGMPAVRQAIYECVADRIRQLETSAAH